MPKPKPGRCLLDAKSVRPATFLQIHWDCRTSGKRCSSAVRYQLSEQLCHAAAGGKLPSTIWPGMYSTHESPIMPSQVMLHVPLEQTSKHDRVLLKPLLPNSQDAKQDSQDARLLATAGFQLWIRSNACSGGHPQPCVSPEGPDNSRALKTRRIPREPKGYP